MDVLTTKSCKDCRYKHETWQSFLDETGTIRLHYTLRCANVLFEVTAASLEEARALANRTLQIDMGGHYG